MRTILSFILMIAFLSCTNDNQDHILLITGGHDYDSVNFIKMFNSYDDLSFDHILHPEANGVYSSDSIDKYDALIFYDLYQDISEDQKTAFLEMLNRGKGIIFLHHSIASYQDWDEFMKILGARYYLQAAVYENDSVPPSTYLDDQDVTAKILDDRHPVTKGLEDFLIHDEVYDYFKVIPEVHPLVSTDHPESGDTLVWANNYGKSRIVYIQFGHDNNAYSNPNFRKLLRQAISWAGRSQ